MRCSAAACSKVRGGSINRLAIVREYPTDAVTADLIEVGLVRIYQVSEDGRQATIGYLHAGEYLGAHTASMLARVVRVVTVRTLGTIRERLAFDLLERASLEQLRSGRFEFAVTQEELADAIGSVREVVNGQLADLRKTGVVATSRGRIRVDDVERLAAIMRRIVT